MAWNDRFENGIDSVISDLGSYLIARGERRPHEIARTKEICRDFIQFIEKDIHKASLQDYAVYKQLHVLTSEDEADYRQMLGDIQQFCESTKNLDGSSSGNPRIDRKRVATRQMNTNDEVMAFLLDRGLSDGLEKSLEKELKTPLGLQSLEDETGRPGENVFSSGEQAQNPHSMIHVSSESTRIPSEVTKNPRAAQDLESTPARFRQNAMRTPSHADVDPIPVHTPSVIPSMLPEKSSTDSLLNSLESAMEPHLGDDRHRKQSLSDSLNAFDFSLDGGLNKNKSKSAESSGLNRKNEFVSPTGDIGQDFSIFFSHSSKENSAERPAFVDRENNIAQQVAENDMSPGLLHAGASPEKNELLRGVSGVEYDFNAQNVEIMRHRDLDKSIKPAAMRQDPLADAALLQAFRPFVFDEKYLIDIPVPKPENYHPYLSGAVQRWLLPLLPVIIGLVLTLLMFIFSSGMGVVFLIITLILAAVLFPDVRTPTQQTAMAAIHSYFAAISSRCYTCGASLLAIDEPAKVDFISLWAPYAAPWPKSIIHRFKPLPLHQTRIVQGAENQNAVVMLCTVGDDYWVVPLVRLDGKWYVTEPSFPKHTVGVSQL